MNVTLLFPSYEVAEASARALGFWDEENSVVKAQGQTIPEQGDPFSWAIDIIGQDPVVVEGTYDDEGNELTPPTKLDGYAVNATGELPPAALQFAIPYGSAGRIFSGSEASPYEYLPIRGKPHYVTASEP